MLNQLLSITEFATKLVSALSGMVVAIIIIAIVFSVKNKKSKEPLVPAKAKNEQNADADSKDKRRKSPRKTRIKQLSATAKIRMAPQTKARIAQPLPQRIKQRKRQATTHNQPIQRKNNFNRTSLCK